METEFFVECCTELYPSTSKVVLKAYKGEGETVNIPLTTEHGDIEVIGESVFSGCDSIKEVVIPDGVEAIGREAFSGCKNLERVHIPNSVRRIYESAFYDCVSLKNIELPSELRSLGASVFARCESLEKMILPSETKNITNSLFRDCTSLREVFLPDGVIGIYQAAFLDCKSLKSIKFPEGLEFIQPNAFENCQSLEKIELPKSFYYAYGRGFKGCSQLKEVSVLGEKVGFHETTFEQCDALYRYNYRFISGFPLEKQLTYIFKLLEHRETVGKEDIAELISYIKRKRSLKTLLFTANHHNEISFLLEHNLKFTLEELEQILQETIDRNRPLITAIFLEYQKTHYSLKEMESFQERKELVEIGLEIPNKKEFKKKWRCSSVDGGLQVSGYKGDCEEEVLPASLEDGTKIVKIACSTGGFKPLKKLVVDAQITCIAPESFRNNDKLEEIVLPDSLLEIGELAFANCNKLKEIRIPDKVTQIKRKTFEHCSRLEKVYGCETLAAVEEYSFSFCTSLKEVSFSRKLRRLETFSFFLSGKMDELKIPETLFLQKPDYFQSLSNKVEFV